MKRLVRIGFVSLAAAVVLFAAFHRMRAQGERSPNAVNAPQASSQSTPEFVTKTSVARTLLATYINQGYSGTTEPSYEGVAIDGLTTIKCPWPGCTLEIEQNVQIGNVNYADNTWYLYVDVDGSQFLAGEAIGQTPLDSDYATGTLIQSGTLTPGTHTVQSFVLSVKGLYLSNYHIDYRVYRP